jgi:hypothetical protein
MFDEEEILDKPYFVCAANCLCCSVGDLMLQMSIFVNCNRSAHHFCAEHLLEQNPVNLLLVESVKDFTKEGKM